jgi:hypothetical protein
MFAKQFVSTIQSEDYEKAVRTVFRIAYLKEKDLAQAKSYFEFLLEGISYENLLNRVSSDYKKKVEKLVTDFGLDVPTAVAVGAGLEDKFKAMEDFINCTALGYANGIFISGEGGTGKTWTVTECLKDLGLEEDSDYIVIKGFSTPVGLFNTLYNNSTKLVVFDDCDSIFKDLAGLNILKAVLDTYPVRTVNWMSAKGSGVDVDRFHFTGRIIFISNINPNTTKDANFRAVMTRVLNIVVGGTREEVRDRIISLVPVIGKEISDDGQRELVNFISENYKRVKNLSIRYLVHLVGLRRYSPDKWQQLAFTLN